MFNWDKVSEAVARRSRDVSAYASAYLRFDTRALLGLSAHAGTKGYLELAAASLAIAASIGIAVNFALSWGQPPQVMSLANTLLWRLIGSCIVLAPFLGLYWFARRASVRLPVTLLAFQQIPATLTLCLAALVATLPQPARTDFANLQSGHGQGTAAYDVACGLLEGSAKVIRFGRGLNALWERSDAAERQLAREEVTTEQFLVERDRRDAAGAALLQAQYQEIARGEVIISAFRDTYPNLQVADLIAIWGLFGFGCVTLWHLTRGLLLGAVSRRRQGAMLALAFGAFCCCALMNYFVGLGASYPEPREFALQWEPGTPGGMGQFKTAAHAFRAGQNRRESRIRSLYEENKVQCPELDRHGLW